MSKKQHPVCPAIPNTIALVGDPNCGKTTLFNTLTGTHQQVGNWSGVTVERKTGYCQLAQKTLHQIRIYLHTLHPDRPRAQRCGSRDECHP